MPLTWEDRTYQGFRPLRQTAVVDSPAEDLRDVLPSDRRVSQAEAGVVAADGGATVPLTSTAAMSAVPARNRGSRV